MTGLYSSPAWRRYRKQRLAVAAANDEPCVRCGGTIDYQLPGNVPGGPTVDHSHMIMLGGDAIPATMEETQPCHQRCNSRHGATAAARIRGKDTAPKRRHRSTAENAARGSEESAGPFFDSEPPKPRARPLSLYVQESRHIPATLSESPREPGELDGLPRRFPPIHPEAVASRGDEFVRFAEARTGKRLLWHQWVSAQRKYEIRADNSFCHPIAFQSVVRQQGKSWSLTEDACWWSSLPHEEPQLTISVANIVTVARAIQASAWRWAEGGGCEVRRLLGESTITWPGGSEWLAIAAVAAYGRRPHRLLADELWSIPPELFWDSLFPALGAHGGNAQVLAYSAANAGDRGLGREFRSRPEVCCMEWGILPDEDPADPAVWRASTAFWFPGREQLLALAAGSPAFAENWLNQWPEAGALSEDWLDLDGWDAGRVEVGVPSSPVVCAMDSDPSGMEFSAAAAWRDGDRVRVRVSGALPSRAEAVAWCARFAPRAVLVGVGLAKVMPRDVRWLWLPYGSRETNLASALFARMVADGSVLHDGTLDDEIRLARAEHRGGSVVLSAKKSECDVTRVKLLVWLCHYCQRNDAVLNIERPKVW